MKRVDLKLFKNKIEMKSKRPTKHYTFERSKNDIHCHLKTVQSQFSKDEVVNELPGICAARRPII